MQASIESILTDWAHARGWDPDSLRLRRVLSTISGLLAVKQPFLRRLPLESEPSGFAHSLSRNACSADENGISDGG